MSVCNSAALVESEIAMGSIDILDRKLNEICCSRPTDVAHRALTKVWWATAPVFRDFELARSNPKRIAGQPETHLSVRVAVPKVILGNVAAITGASN